MACMARMTRMALKTTNREAERVMSSKPENATRSTRGAKDMRVAVV